VKEALTEAVGEDAHIQLDEVPGDRIEGVVLSRSFANQSVAERQDHIGKHLDTRLSPSERSRIVFILTDTPEEFEALRTGPG
jgi:hypothetical protein